MNNLKKVVAVQDESSHWYIIPAEMRNEFHDIIDKSCNDKRADQYAWQDLFLEKFYKYKTGGDLNNIQLYAEI